jgi:hypothetical protein
MKTPRSEKLTIKPAPVEAATATTEDAGEKRPRNLPAVNVRSEGFSLVVDGKAKSHYADAATASEAALKLKRSFPMLQVQVYDAVEGTRIGIELPDAATALETHA